MSLKPLPFPGQIQQTANCDLFIIIIIFFFFFFFFFCFFFNVRRDLKLHANCLLLVKTSCSKFISLFPGNDKTFFLIFRLLRGLPNILRIGCGFGYLYYIYYTTRTLFYHLYGEIY